ncbi:hypothetical protein LCGC14_0590400 [marine sediment metagenome]|uniref:Zinc-ribbon domain-containing protein n=1 Tax=marine sediment metagenome TaxID=412755 RepID=A0A0F9RXF8_9ZZZZ|nr:MAG: hypothetical protein Lokiarch_11880 [Candidatus Lokiarchaeum sp. GC14_75]HEA70596.1 zinc ribbon domain-containing protein [archaeon]
MAKLCTDCGASVQAEWNVCAECGAPVLKKRRIPIQGSKKIRHIKISVIVTMIIGTVVVVSQAGIGLSYSNYSFSLQSLMKAYDDEKISNEEYRDRIDALEYQFYLEMWVISNVDFYAKIGLNVAFIFVIIGFLSVSFDNLFPKKTRRISLIIACVFLIFGLYSIFIPAPTIALPYYYL